MYFIKMQSWIDRIHNLHFLYLRHLQNEHKSERSWVLTSNWPSLQKMEIEYLIWNLYILDKEFFRGIYALWIFRKILSLLQWKKHFSAKKFVPERSNDLSYTRPNIASKHSLTPFLHTKIHFICSKVEKSRKYYES